MSEQIAYRHAACALLSCTPAGRVTHANATLLRWLGRTEDSAPDSLQELFTRPSLLFFEMHMRPLLALGRTIDGGFLTLHHANGSTIPVVLNACQAVDGDSIEMAMIVVREREQYEQRLLQSREDAERALETLRTSAHGQKMQAVGQMAAGFAHEFNNLLAVIKGNVGFAQDGVRHDPLDPARILDDLTHAMGATDRAAAIVKQLLAFTGREVVVRSMLDLNTIVRDTTPLLVTTLGQDATWQTRLHEALWPVFAPRDQLQLVLTNLVLNARDAVRANGAPGLVSVLTENIGGTSASADLVRLTVEDTGTGMPEAVRTRAFDPFFTTKGVGQGMGLGLSMVYGTIAALGGRSIIDSSEGGGTRVMVELPRAYH